MKGARARVSWLVVALATAIAVVRAVLSRDPIPLLHPKEARPLVRQFVRSEPTRRLDAERAFPGDPWSQDDDFHHQEERWIHTASDNSSVSIGELLDGIDDEIRAHGRSPQAVPCKPRPLDD